MRAWKLSGRVAVAAALAAVSALVACSAAAADTIVVDEQYGTGNGSLQAAIRRANSDPGRDAIRFSRPRASYSLPGSGSGPANQPLIKGNLDIFGPVSVWAEAGRTFEIASSAKVRMYELTIHGGRHQDPEAVGGVILNRGTLLLDHVAVTDGIVVSTADTPASGGGIANSGDLTLIRSGVRGTLAQGRFGEDASGGAIANSGTLSLMQSTLEDNAVHATSMTEARGGGAVGGAIANTGELSVAGSLLAHNSVVGGAGGDAGGLGLGGGIFNSGDGTFRLENSTVAQNSASSDDPRGQSYGGGIANNSASQAQSLVRASTIAQNSGGHGSNLANSTRTLGLQDSILAYGRASGNCGAFSGSPDFAVTSLGYNLDDGATCQLRAAGDRSSKDPQLQPLATNDGWTKTMAIPLSSPALDQGTSGGLTTDQRGKKRPVFVPGVPRPEGGDGADIGAYEYQPSQAGGRPITGSVKPGRARAGERTCFRFKATRPAGGPMANVQARLGGKRARTDEHGNATICKRLRKAGIRHPRLRKRGYERARLRVAVRR